MWQDTHVWASSRDIWVIPAIDYEIEAFTCDFLFNQPATGLWKLRIIA